MIFQLPTLNQFLQDTEGQAVFAIACRIAREQAMERIVTPGGHKLAGNRVVIRRSRLHF